MMSLIIAADQENEVTDLLEAVKAKFPSIISMYVGFNQKRNDSLFEVKFKKYMAKIISLKDYTMYNFISVQNHFPNQYKAS